MQTKRKLVGEYHMPNGRKYQIVDTGEPYKLGYPEINSGTTHLTSNTGIAILSKLDSGTWAYISTAETIEDAKETIGMFSRIRNNIDQFKVK